MEPIGIVVLITLVVVLGALVKAVEVIRQSSAAVVERFGRYTRTLDAGVHFVVPFVDSIRNRIDLREQVVPFPPQPVITQDDLVVTAETVIYYEVTDPRAATYEVASYIQAIEQLVLTTLRNIVGEMDLDRALTSRVQINAVLQGVLDEATGKWGIRVNRVDVKSIEPPAPIRESMEKQRRADRDKRAAILQAEGVRQSEILRAEGEKAAALLRAQTEREVQAIKAGGADAIQGDGDGAGRTLPHPHPWAQLPSLQQPLRKDDPRRIGRYELTARLGQGGMGTVYLGRSPGERLVAVKVIQRELAADPTFRKRFGREIEAARRVGGFHTASVVAADPQGEPPWLVTDYIPGPSLHHVLGQHGALPVKTVHTLAVGIAEALEGIHACGIVHRDLKPSNIIISDTGPRVIDFGIARALDSTRITRADHVIGTQGFLAPEQLTGAPVTFATDVYTFGVVLCHAAGAVPAAHGGSSEPELGLLPSTLSGLVTRCLDHDPERRPTPTEVVEELSGIRSPGDWLPPAVRTMVELHTASTVAVD